MTHINKQLLTAGTITQDSAGTGVLSFRPHRPTESGTCHVMATEVPSSGTTYTSKLYGSLLPIPSVGTGTLLAGPFSGEHVYTDIPQLPYLRVDVTVTGIVAEGGGTFLVYVMEPSS